MLPYDTFEQYAPRWEEAIRQRGHAIELLPGDAFAPRLWNVAVIPRFDFFWPQPHDPVVSARIATLLQENKVTGISFREVVLDKVGTAESVDDVTMPDSGDAVDVFDSNSWLEEPSTCGQFFEVVRTINDSIGRPAGYVKTLSECPRCGRRDWEEANDYERRRNYFRKKRILPVSDIPEADVFWSHIFYEGLIVSDRVRSLLPDRLENCLLEQLDVTNKSF